MSRPKEQDKHLSYQYVGRNSFGLAVYRVYLMDLTVGMTVIGKIGTTQRIAFSQAPGQWTILTPDGATHWYDSWQEAGSALLEQWKHRHTQRKQREQGPRRDA